MYPEQKAAAELPRGVSVMQRKSPGSFLCSGLKSGRDQDLTGCL